MPRAVFPKQTSSPVLENRLRETARTLNLYRAADVLWLRENCGDLYPCVECDFLAPGAKPAVRPVFARNCLHVDRPNLKTFLQAGGALLG